MAVFAAKAQQFPAQDTDDHRITISATLTIAEAFARIESQSGHSIAYGQSKLDTTRKITLALSGATLDEALVEILKSTGLTYKASGYHIIITPQPEKPQAQPQVAPRNVTVSGRVTDSATGEVVIGCVVFDRASNRGATTNAYGFYSLTLPAGRITLQAGYLGYQPFESEVDLTRNTTLDIALTASATTIEQVTVVAGVNNPLTSDVGVVTVPISRVKNAPVLLGESDLMKSLQYIPGVQGGTEGKADLSVRGGSPDQNLILLDGNPLYNVGHLFGFVSVFNTDALKNVTLYKSGFPARFGGRLSSVIDINTKDGDKERFGGTATIGLLAAKFNVEGPIVKGKTSFTLSGRRSWADSFMGSLQEDDFKTTFYFYDINAKLHHKISDRTSAYLTVYNGRDRLRNTDQYIDGKLPAEAPPGATPVFMGYDYYGKQDWTWGNTIVAARLNSAIRGNLFMNANLSYNRYHFNNAMSERIVFTEASGNKGEVTNGINYDSGISDYTATMELEYIPVPSHYIRAGVQGVYHDFRPEALRFRSSEEGGDRDIAGGRIPAGEVSLYTEDEWDVTPRLTLNAGVRASMFNVKGKTYGGLDPRLSAKYRVSDNVSVKAGYSRMQQYIHLLSNNSLIFQTDLWVPATSKVKPMNSTQYSAGVYVALPKLFDISVEGYYKDMKNVIEYKDGASFTGQSSGWENKVEAGIGRSFGVEVSIERRVGSTTGVLSYAWSKSERRFTEINYGKWFPAKFDRRHTVNFTVSQRLSRKFDLTASWTYATGERVTVPMMTAMIVRPDGGWWAPPDSYQLDGRNNYRAPAYHRLDVGLNFHPKKWRNPERYGEWNLSVYNAYNRMNAFKLFLDSWSNGDGTTRLSKIVLFPILPSISYTYNF
jgi:outer membrane receptor for ferrienterochelin and colicin